MSLPKLVPRLALARRRLPVSMTRTEAWAASLRERVVLPLPGAPIKTAEGSLSTLELRRLHLFDHATKFLERDILNLPNTFPGNPKFLSHFLQRFLRSSIQ